MATTFVTDRAAKREPDARLVRSSWAFDADDASTTWATWNGGEATLAVESPATYGGGTLTWYARVVVGGVELIREIGDSPSTDDTQGKRTFLNKCEVRPLLSGATAPDIVAIIC